LYDNLVTDLQGYGNELGNDWQQLETELGNWWQGTAQSIGNGLQGIADWVKNEGPDLVRDTFVLEVSVAATPGVGEVPLSYAAPPFVAFVERAFGKTAGDFALNAVTAAVNRLGALEGTVQKFFDNAGTAVAKFFKQFAAEETTVATEETTIATNVVKSYRGTILRSSSEGIQSPNADIRSWVSQFLFYRDPLTNQIVPRSGPLQADHIVPKSVIDSMPGFSSLTPSQKSAVLNYPPNFQPLPQGLNQSKGNLLVWPTYKGQPVSPEYASWLANQQELIYPQLRSLIDYYRVSNSLTNLGL
jgi:hypothetical protein